MRLFKLLRFIRTLRFLNLFELLLISKETRSDCTNPVWQSDCANPVWLCQRSLTPTMRTQFDCANSVSRSDCANTVWQYDCSYSVWQSDCANSASHLGRRRKRRGASCLLCSSSIVWTCGCVIVCKWAWVERVWKGSEISSIVEFSLSVRVCVR
jgi:hypothetical protein